MCLSWGFELLKNYSFHQVWEIFDYISSDIPSISPFLSAPSGTTIIHILVYSVISYRFLRLSYFYSFFLFLFIRQDNLNGPVFKFSDLFFPVYLCCWVSLEMNVEKMRVGASFSFGRKHLFASIYKGIPSSFTFCQVQCKSQKIFRFVHFVLHSMWESKSLSCSTLCNTMDRSLPGFSVHGIL